MSSLRCRIRSPTAAPLEDDDLLSEILLRLPPQPSSLPRASAICRRWRSLVSDPHFSRRFRVRHGRNPPLLGCFVVETSRHINFQPALEAPNRVPQGRFTFPIAAGDRFVLLGCRHGLVLSFHDPQKQLQVWDPVIGDQHFIDVPPGFDSEVSSISGAVLRADGGVRYFQVVLVGTSNVQQMVASVYSSKTGVWGDLCTAFLPSEVPISDLPSLAFISKPAVMAGDSLYWKLECDNNFVGMLEFHLEKQSLAIIQAPTEASGSGNHHTWDIMTQGCGIYFLFLIDFGLCAQLWKRKTDWDCIASWVLERTIELDKVLPNSEEDIGRPFIIGFAEENNVVVVRTSIGIFSVQLESLQIKKLSKPNFWCRYYPFEGVYTIGIPNRGI